MNSADKISSRIESIKISGTFDIPLRIAEDQDIPLTIKYNRLEDRFIFREFGVFNNIIGGSLLDAALRRCCRYACKPGSLFFIGDFDRVISVAEIEKFSGFAVENLNTRKLPEIWLLFFSD